MAFKALILSYRQQEIVKSINLQRGTGKMVKGEVRTQFIGFVATIEKEGRNGRKGGNDIRRKVRR